MRKITALTVVVCVVAASTASMADQYAGTRGSTLAVDTLTQASVYKDKSGEVATFTLVPTSIKGCTAAVQKNGLTFNIFCLTSSARLAPIFYSVEEFSLNE